MKSIKEKAEAYDKVLEWATEAHKVCDGMLKEDLEHLFPELKDSEDEMIRKEIITYLYNELNNITQLTPRTNEFERWISWLEKQGGHAKFINGIQVGDKVTRNEDGVLVNLSQLNRVAKKQGEQKPTDKVEPKFHEGDWIITNKNHIWYVDETPETTSYLYRLIYQYGKVEVAEFEVVDKKARLWTIQDAKDGDVLEFGDHGRLVVGIVNYINKTTGKVDVNCLLENNGFKVGNYYNLDTINPHPATKEQRDTLKKAMANAGYRWDKEKLKLEKI